MNLYQIDPCLRILRKISRIDGYKFLPKKLSVVEAAAVVVVAVVKVVVVVEKSFFRHFKSFLFISLSLSLYLYLSPSLSLSFFLSLSLFFLFLLRRWMQTQVAWGQKQELMIIKSTFFTPTHPLRPAFFDLCETCLRIESSDSFSFRFS
jgi:hypothetical protein